MKLGKEYGKEKAIKIVKFETQCADAWVYLIINVNTKNAVVIDCGMVTADFYNYIATNNISLKAILLTHGHYDHIMSANTVAKRYNVDIYAHSKEKVILENIDLNFSSYYFETGMKIESYKFLEDEQKLSLAGFCIKVLYTKGHTPGGVCYYFPDEETVFTGDTLFYLSVGRSDFELSDGIALKNSIKQKLLTLPEETIVYPGHGKITTIKFEKKSNMFLR